MQMSLGKHLELTEEIIRLPDEANPVANRGQSYRYTDGKSGVREDSGDQVQRRTYIGKQATSRGLGILSQFTRGSFLAIIAGSS